MSFNNTQLQPEIVKDILSGLANLDGDYIADAMLPGIPTNFERGSIPTLAAGSHFGLLGETGRRSPGGEVSVGPGVGYGTVDYLIEVFDRAERLPKEIQRRSQVPIPLLTQYLAMAVNFLRVGREQRLAAVLTNAATVWANGAGGVAAGGFWDGAGDPVADISTAAETIAGGHPDTIAMGKETWEGLRRNALLLAALKTTQDNALMNESSFASAVASHFGVGANRIFIGRAQALNSADPDDVNVATALADIHGDYFWIGQVGGLAAPMANGDLLMQPSAVARVIESDFEDEFDSDWLITHKSWQVQTGIAEQILPVTPGLAALITNTHT